MPDRETRTFRRSTEVNANAFDRIYRIRRIDRISRAEQAL
jgi:hypothetical protein